MRACVVLSHVVLPFSGPSYNLQKRFYLGRERERDKTRRSLYARHGLLQLRVLLLFYFGLNLELRSVSMRKVPCDLGFLSVRRDRILFLFFDNSHG